MMWRTMKEEESCRTVSLLKFLVFLIITERHISSYAALFQVSEPLFNVNKFLICNPPEVDSPRDFHQLQNQFAADSANTLAKQPRVVSLPPAASKNSFQQSPRRLRQPRPIMFFSTVSHFTSILSLTRSGHTYKNKLRFLYYCYNKQ